MIFSAPPKNSPAGKDGSLAEPKGACRRCGRILKNPVHAAAGIGPVCATKGSRGGVGVSTGVASRCRARYEKVSAEAARLVIRDLGPWDIHPTVTNDAENVVAELAEEGMLWDGRRLFYYDSEGRLDELLVRDGRFAGFASGWPSKADGR